MCLKYGFKELYRNNISKRTSSQHEYLSTQNTRKDKNNNGISVSITITHSWLRSWRATYYAFCGLPYLSGFCSSEQRFAASRKRDCFGFGFATDTLAFGLIVPLGRDDRKLSPPSSITCQARRVKVTTTTPPNLNLWVVTGCLRRSRCDRPTLETHNFRLDGVLLCRNFFIEQDSNPTGLVEGLQDDFRNDCQWCGKKQANRPQQPTPKDQ